MSGLGVSMIIGGASSSSSALERCLFSALDQSVPALEVVVIGGEPWQAFPRPLQAALVASHGAVVHWEETSPRGSIYEAAREHAAGEIIGVLDGDSVVGSDWVASVVDALSSSTVDAVAGPVRYYDAEHIKLGRRGVRDIRMTQSAAGMNPSFLHGRNIAARQSSWREVDSSEHSGSNAVLEDVELATKFFNAGKRVVYEPRMIVSVSASSVLR